MSYQAKGQRALFPVVGVLLVLMANACSQSASNSPSASSSPTESSPSATNGPSAAATTPQIGGTLRVAVANNADISTIDVINATTSGFAVANSIYEGLFQAKPEGGVIPGLAAMADVSADGLTWTFTLRSGVTFHDGTDFDAAAVKTNIDARMSSATFNKGLLATVSEVKVVDSGTVQFLLSASTPALPLILSGVAFGMESPTAMSKYPGADYIDHAAGTGPFMLDGATSTTGVTLVRNDQYWGQKAYLDRVVFSIIPDLSARTAAVEAGDVDVAEAITGSEYDRLGAGGKVAVGASSVADQVLYLWFNTGKGVFTDKRVRQAAVYGLDKANYPPTYFGLGQSADSLVAPYLSGYAAQTPYPYDQAKARTLLSDAGVPAGTNVKLIALGEDPARAAQLVKQDLDALGFQVTIQTLDVAGWIPLMTTAADASDGWQISVSSAGYPYADAEAPLRRNFLGSADAPQGSNWVHYVNPAVDSLLAQQSSTVDPTARNEILAEIQGILWDDVPAHPLLFYRNARAMSTSVRDLVFINRSEPYLARTWLAP